MPIVNAIENLADGNTGKREQVCTFIRCFDNDQKHKFLAGAG
ncbi:MAG: hypothetical protein ACLRR3_16130 [Eubacterium sp.]